MAENEHISTLFRRSDKRVTDIVRGEPRTHVEVTPLGKGHFVGRLIKTARRTKLATEKPKVRLVPEG